MKRTTKLIAAAVTLAVMITGVAIAASSPTVSTGPATSIHNTGAELHATINPNGNDTGYVFQYGLTNALGVTTKSHSAGHGTSAVSEKLGIGGLTPGTIYRYRVEALNRAGAAVGAERTFKTTGPPPAGVVTGPAINVSRTGATVTGTVTTNGATTTWAVQYGATASYGVQSFGQQLPVSPTPTPVALQLSGLAPATLFHYRFVGYHGSKVVSDGSDGTFFTLPLHRSRSRLSTRTRPRFESSRPYVFTTAGIVRGGAFMPASARCTGNVGLRYYRGGRQIGFIVAPVGSNCRFGAQASFHRIRGPKPESIRVRIDFRGNGYLKPSVRANFVTVG